MFGTGTKKTTFAIPPASKPIPGRHYLILEQGHIIKESETVSFTIQKPIGKGSTSSVFHAVRNIDIDGERDFALKISIPDPHIVKGMEVEVSYHQQIQKLIPEEHSSKIVKIYYSFVYRKSLCVVLEFNDVPFHKMVEKNQHRMDLNLVRRTAHNVLTVLNIMHTIPLIHGDIKPDNLMFNRKSPEVKLGDFGSTISSSESFIQYFQTRYYRSPESVLQIGYDSKVDIWSLGCSLFELLVGAPLFEAENQDHLLLLILSLIRPIDPAMIQIIQNKHPTIFLNGDLKNEDDFLNEIHIKRKRKLDFRNKDLKSLLLEHNKINQKLLESEDVALLHKFIDLLEKCLIFDYHDRFSSNEAINHPFFEGFN